MTRSSVVRMRLIALAVLLLLSSIAYTALRRTAATKNDTAMSTHLPESKERIAAEKLHRSVFSIYIILSALSVIAGVAVWKTGNAVQDATQRDNERRIESLQRTTESATTRADKAQTNLLELKRQVDGRSLSQEQLTAIRDSLLTHPAREAQVICPSGNEEAYAFAKQVTRALESAHWRTGGTIRKDSAPQNTGVTLFAARSDGEVADQLRDALSKAGIWSSINANNSLPGIIRVYVGPRP